MTNFSVKNFTTTAAPVKMRLGLMMKMIQNLDPEVDRPLDHPQPSLQVNPGMEVVLTLDQRVFSRIGRDISSWKLK